MTAFDQRLAPVLTAPVPRLRDGRGSLTKLFLDDAFNAPGFGMERRQVLYSATDRAGVVRGLHAQQKPYTEAKIIVALSGRTYWVTVDLRAGSRSFGRWQGFELSADGEDGAGALQIPTGFAHGCVSLSDGVGLMIVADQPYVHDHGIGIAWNDPELAIEWPVSDRTPTLSDEHAGYASFAEFRDRYGSL